MPITDKAVSFKQQPSEVPPSKTNTNWAALKGYAITSLQCEDYQEFFRRNDGCHTRIRPSVEGIVNHIQPAHHLNRFGGGGFVMHLRNADKNVKLWDQLADAGLEATDFRCEICDEQVAFSVMAIEKHMKMHSGKTRRVKEGKVFKIAINQPSVVAPVDEDVFED